MQCILDPKFLTQVGLEQKAFEFSDTSQTDETGTVHFYPQKIKTKNYKKYCCDGGQVDLQDENEMEKIIKQYTNHETFYCTKINLLLAADSAQIVDHKDYIKKLRYCISKLSNYFPVTVSQVYRGLQCSSKEFESYQTGKIIHIPSFLSTSMDPNKAYTKFNTILIIYIKYRPGCAFVVSSKYSRYSDKEQEVLFGCYSKFKVINKQSNKLFNKKNFEFCIELLHVNDRIFVHK